MNFDFTDDQQAIKRTAKDLLAQRFKPDTVRELAEAQRYDDANWSELSELGWPGIFVDEEHGGQGLGTVELAVLLEELGYALAPLPCVCKPAGGGALAPRPRHRHRGGGPPGGPPRRSPPRSARRATR
ncbi:MAG: acyl-CoA dehydrogenase family protein [Gaiellaceae bacterium]